MNAQLSWNYCDERNEWRYGDCENGDGAIMFWERYENGAQPRWRVIVYINGNIKGWIRANSQDLDKAKEEIENIIERCTSSDW